MNWIRDNAIVSCGADGLIRIWRTQRYPQGSKLLRTCEGHVDQVNQIKVNNSRSRLASCSNDRTARIWSLTNLERDSDPSLVFSGHKSSIEIIGWCPYWPKGSPEILATASTDGNVRLWDTFSGECLHSIGDHTQVVRALTFSPNGRFFASGSEDGWCYAYDVLAGKSVWSHHVDDENQGILEIEWQISDTYNRIVPRTGVGEYEIFVRPPDMV